MKKILKRFEIRYVKTFVMLSILVLALLLNACNTKENYSKYLDLYDYTLVTLDYKEIEAKEEELDHERSLLLSMKAKKIDISDDYIKKDDSVNIDYDASINNKPFDGGIGKAVDIEVGKGKFLEDLENQLIGKKAQESYTIKVVFPEDFKGADNKPSNLAGKEAVFNVRVNKVTRTIYPDYDDAFVLSLNLEQKTTKELDSYLKNGIEEYNLVEKTWDYIIANTNVKKYPKQVDEKVAEIRQYYEMQMVYYGYISFNQFCLDAFGHTEEEFDNINRKSVEENTKNEMVAKEIARLENIDLDLQEINQGLKDFMSHYGYTNMDAFLEDYDQEYLKSGILTKKVMEYTAKLTKVIGKD